MFEDISDDVYLVQRYDTKSFSKREETIKGSWLYQQLVYLILYATKKINQFSKEYRKIMQTLIVEKKLLMVNLITLILFIEHNQID